MSTLQFPQEHLLHLTIDRGPQLCLICSDAALVPLAYGFLYNEGLISQREDVCAISLSPDRREMFVSLRTQPSSDAPIQAAGIGGPPLRSDTGRTYSPLHARYTLDYIRSCAARMEALSHHYQETGGMHCSALFDAQCMLCLFEDIGRHNTLDKLAGHCLIKSVCATDAILTTTGRISLDMVRKAANMGVSVIASCTTPTRQAVDAALAANITLIRYIGRGGTVCTAPERIAPSA